MLLSTLSFYSALFCSEFVILNMTHQKKQQQQHKANLSTIYFLNHPF